MINSPALDLRSCFGICWTRCFLHSFKHTSDVSSISTLCVHFIAKLHLVFISTASSCAVCLPALRSSRLCFCLNEAGLIAFISGFISGHQHLRSENSSSSFSQTLWQFYHMWCCLWSPTVQLRFQNSQHFVEDFDLEYPDFFPFVFDFIRSRCWSVQGFYILE